MSKNKTLTCPKCGSVSVEIVSAKKKFSGKKAIAGAIITAPLAGVSAPLGAMAGFIGKKGKTKCHCLQCGNIFDKKI